MNRRRMALYVAAAVVVAAGVVLGWTGRDAATTAAPGAPTTVTATPTPTATQTLVVAGVVPQAAPFDLVDLGRRYVAAYQFGATSGGQAWIDREAAVATPQLVKADVLSDPEEISTAPILTIGVEAQSGDSGTVLLELRDGTKWRLVVTGGLVSAVENARPR